MRLNKFIAHSGVCSRRAADKLIFSGKVLVNGEKNLDPSTDIDEMKDIVQVNGEKISLEEEKVYYLLNKPIGYMSSVYDPKYDKFVTDLIKDKDHRLYPVGRLDVDSEGLLLLTNDGELTLKLTHPSHNISKTYFVELEYPLKSHDINRLESGVTIDEKYEVKGKLDNIINKTCLITIYEGRNRQVRKMFEAVGNKVLVLKRVSIELLTLGNIKVGEYRQLTIDEIKYLEQL